MGHGNFAICESCGYEREFMLGVGMMYGSLQNILEFMDKRSSEEVSKILQEYPDPHYETDYRLQNNNSFLFEDRSVLTSDPFHFSHNFSHSLI